jgi:hypothetical protein
MTTQDGYDWPNGQHDEQCWPAAAVQPMAPYFREQMREAAGEFRCRSCGGTIAQHDRLLRCRREMRHL